MELTSSVSDICMINRIYDCLEQIKQDDLEARQDSVSIILISRISDPVSLSRALLVEDLPDYVWLAEGHFMEEWVCERDPPGKVTAVKTGGRPWTGRRGYVTYHRRLRTSVRAALQCWFDTCRVTRTNHPVSGQRGYVSQTLEFAFSLIPRLIWDTSRYASLCRKYQGWGHVWQVMM